jgi:hypothetical protein
MESLESCTGTPMMKMCLDSVEFMHDRRTILGADHARESGMIAE